MVAERILMGLLLGGVAWGCVWVLMPFWSALLWAGILVFTTWPLFNWFRHYLRIRRGWAAGLMVLLTAVVLVLPLGDRRTEQRRRRDGPAPGSDGLDASRSSRRTAMGVRHPTHWSNGG